MINNIKKGTYVLLTALKSTKMAQKLTLNHRAYIDDLHSNTKLIGYS